MSRLSLASRFLLPVAAALALVMALVIWLATAAQTRHRLASAGRKPPLESLCSIPASPRPFESLQIRTIVAKTVAGCIASAASLAAIAACGFVQTGAPIRAANSNLDPG